MSEQQQKDNFRYVYNGKEVSKEEFQNLTGENFKWFEGNSVMSVDLSSFNNFFDGNFKSERQINDHLKSVMEENTVNSTRHKSQAGETHKEVRENSIRIEKEIIEYLQGVKETEGKLNYELDWNFIQQIAERMSQNKDKYEPYNWKRPMEVEKLKQSLLRHVVEVMKGNYSDDGREFGHFESIALNSMMINYQLKNNG